MLKVLGYVAAALVGLMFIGALSEKSPSQKASDACNSSTDALYISRQFVRERLKAPSTASFGSPSESRTTALGNCRHTVISYVDAQNSFGAKIRSTYSATVKFSHVDGSGNPRWVLENLDL